METGKTLPDVVMLRENLDNIPAFALPKPYKLRTYGPGDEETWFRIWTRADEEHHAVKPETFRESFGTDAGVLGKRQFFIRDGNGEDIGTASAWFRDEYKGKPWGLVHWVAIVPEAQGKGLSKPLMSRVMTRLKELGHERVMLVTQHYRIKAINLYLGLGFMPDLANEDHVRAWRAVREALPGTVLDTIDLGGE